MLDPEGRRDVLGHRARFGRSGTGILLITHDLAEAARADRAVVLDHGAIVFSGIADGAHRARPSFSARAGSRCRRSRVLAARLRELGRGVRRLTSLEPEATGGGAVALTLDGIGYTYAAGTGVRRARARLACRSRSSQASSSSCSARPVRASPRCCGSRPGCSTPAEGGATIDGDAADRARRARGRSGSSSRTPSPSSSPRPSPPTSRSARATWGCREPRPTRLRAMRSRRVGLPPEEYGARSPFSLSGGEARRAAIAGVLAMQPALPAARRAHRRTRRARPRRRARRIVARRASATRASSW